MLREALHDAPGAVTGAAGELAWQRAAQLGQHQVDGLGRDLEQLGPEWHRHQRARQEQPDQLRQLRVAAGLGCDPVHQLAREDQPVEVLVGDCQRLLETLQKPSSFSFAPSLPCGRNFDCLNPAASGSRWLVRPRARRMEAAMMRPSQGWRV